MRHLRNAAAGSAHLLGRSGVVVWLVLILVTAAVAISSSSSADARVNRGRPRLDHRLVSTVGVAAHRLTVPPRGKSVHRHFAWRPRLHHVTVPWMQAGTHRSRLRAPAEAIVDPFAERWQADAVPVATEPARSDAPDRLLRMDAARDSLVHAPFLIRSFPRPPPVRL